MDKKFVTKIGYGSECLEDTWQNEFKPVTYCSHCNWVAKIAFTLFEPGGGPHGEGNSERKAICHLYKNDFRPGEFWPHDYCAFAVYLCTKCGEATTLYNQA